MKATNVLFAGFGGHGMLLAGKLLSVAVIKEGKEVSWLPAYGAEMRGGTANVTVCMSNEAVGSPYIECPDSLVVMNTPSLLKFGPKVKPGGLIIINSSLVKDDYTREDCNVFKVPAGEIAMNLGNTKATNLVLLGTYAGLSKIVPQDSIEDAISETFASKPKFIPLNISAFLAGYREGAKLCEEANSDAAQDILKAAAYM